MLQASRAPWEHNDNLYAIEKIVYNRIFECYEKGKNGFIFKITPVKRNLRSFQMHSCPYLFIIEIKCYAQFSKAGQCKCCASIATKNSNPMLKTAQHRAHHFDHFSLNREQLVTVTMKLYLPVFNINHVNRWYPYIKHWQIY